jgi:hypothetical protein
MRSRVFAVGPIWKDMGSIVRRLGYGIAFDLERATRAAVDPLWDGNTTERSHFRRARQCYRLPLTDHESEIMVPSKPSASLPNGFGNPSTERREPR